MVRLILASLVLAISILPSYAQGTILHTDRAGYTTGIDGSRTVNTYTDRYGNTTGSIGGKYISTYSDGYGGTTLARHFFRLHPEPGDIPSDRGYPCSP